MAQIIEITIRPEMIKKAEAAAEEMGRLRNSITSGDGNLAGFVGEIMVAEYTGAIRANTYDYDLLLGPIKIDVKTKRTTARPRPFYECSVADFNTKQQCDWYVFTRVMNDLSVGWILGHMPKDEFYRAAVFHKAGEVDTSNNFTFKADCYNISVSVLRPVVAYCTPQTAQDAIDVSRWDARPRPERTQQGNNRPQIGYDWLYQLGGRK